MTEYILRKNGEMIYKGSEQERLFELIPQEGSTYRDGIYDLASIGIYGDKVRIAYTSNVKIFLDGNNPGIRNRDKKVESINIPRKDLENLLSRFVSFKLD